MDVKYYYYTDTGLLYGITKHDLNIPGVEYTLTPCPAHDDIVKRERAYYINNAWEIRII